MLERGFVQLFRGAISRAFAENFTFIDRALRRRLWVTLRDCDLTIGLGGSDGFCGRAG